MLLGHTKASVPPYQAVCRSLSVAGSVSLAACSHGPEAVVMGQVGWARARVSEAIRVVSSLERLQARSPCLAPCQAGCVYPDDCVARPAHRNAMSAQDKLAVLAVAAGIDSAAIGAVVEAAPARSHVRGRTAHNPGHALRAARASASAAVDTAKLQAAELAVRASATRSLALLPARTHCAGPALLGRPSRFKHCARRCPASPLPQRRTPPARQPQSSRCVPPPDAVWRCFLRARTARASSACQTITLHALCAQVPGKSAAAAPDATSAPAADLAVRATLAIARPWQPSVGTHALHEPLSA